LGWITLNNMARVGANYAALHPQAWPGSSTDPVQVQYRALMMSSMNTTDCAPVPSSLPDPSFGPNRDPGSFVRVDLTCRFQPITPLIGNIVGSIVSVSTHSVFAIGQGCIADCPTFGPSPTPSSGTLDNCRTIPTMVDQSVAGARLAWANAGFLGSNFSPTSGLDTRTVTSQTVTPAPDAQPCPSGKAFFNASVSVTIAPLPTPPPSPTCLYVPNVRGMLVSDARAAWTSTGFTGQFAPGGQDSMIVISQTTTPDSQPGDCLDPDTSIVVSYTSAPPPPPAPPCKVPSLVNTSSNGASGTWTGAGFTAGNLSYVTNGGHPLPYTIRSQTLVGGTYVACSASIVLSWK